MWWDYVQQVAKGAKQADIAERAGVNQVTVSRWKKGAESARPENVAAFARAYGRPVLEAFIAAGFLTAEEADARPDTTFTASDLDNAALLNEIARRLQRATQEYLGSDFVVQKDVYSGSFQHGTPIKPVDEDGLPAWPVYSPEVSAAEGESRSRAAIEKALLIARSNRSDLNELPSDLPETIRLKARADKQVEELERELAAASTAAG